MADEKIPFLAYLSSVLKDSSFCKYEPPAGSKHFRNLIAGFLKTYHRVPLNTDVRRYSCFAFGLFSLFVYHWLCVSSDCSLSFLVYVSLLFITFVFGRLLVSWFLIFLLFYFWINFLTVLQKETSVSLLFK